MRILTGNEELEAAKFIDFAAEIAKLSSCYPLAVRFGDRQRKYRDRKRI